MPGLAALERGAAVLGYRLTEEQRGQFARYLECLLVANRSMNLTSVRDPELIQQRHFLESLAVGMRLAERGLLIRGTKVLDLGSGAGLPGIPIRLLWPRIALTLVDATAKKTRFLADLVETLELRSVDVITARAENLGQEPACRERFDVLTARAVAELPVLVELALPLLRLGGVCAAVKGSRADEELAAAAKAINILGGCPLGQAPLIAGQAPRLVLIEKVRPTPERYPRRPGRPAARPIG